MAIKPKDRVTGLIQIGVLAFIATGLISRIPNHLSDLEKLQSQSHKFQSLSSQVRSNHAWLSQSVMDSLAPQVARDPLRIPTTPPSWMSAALKRDLEGVKEHFIIPGLVTDQDSVKWKSVQEEILTKLNSLESYDQSLLDKASSNQWESYSLTFRDYLNTLESIGKEFDQLSGFLFYSYEDAQHQIRSHLRYELAGLVAGVILLAAMFLIGFLFRSETHATEQETPLEFTTTREIKIKEAEIEEERAVSQRFSAQMAHELRNPLQSMSLELECAVEMVSSVFESAKKNPEFFRHLSVLQENLKAISDGMDRLQSIADTHLRFGKLNAGKHEKIKLEELLTRAIAQEEATFRANHVQCEWQISALSGGWVLGNEHLLLQVLQNLFRNSIEAMQQLSPNETRVIRIEGSIDLHQQARIYIKDTGPGLSPKITARLFKPYSTTKTNGTGLGLSFSKQVLEMHGGDLRYIETERTTGACFLWTTPIFYPEQLRHDTITAEIPEKR